jgi:hypothetical protein
MVDFRDLAWRGPQPLREHDLNSLPIIGAKAAQLAQLSKVTSERAKCVGPVRTPSDAFAVPVVHSREHIAVGDDIAVCAVMPCTWCPALGRNSFCSCALIALPTKLSVPFDW